MRAYIEHGFAHASQPVMLWYKGFFFSAENPQKSARSGIFPIRFGNYRRRQADRRSDDYPNFHPGTQRAGTRPIIVHINSVGDKECRGVVPEKLIAYYRKYLSNLQRLQAEVQRKSGAFGLQRNKMLNKKKRPQSIDSLCASCKQHLKKLMNFLRQTA